MYNNKFQIEDLHKYPFVRYVLPLIAGILIQIQFEIAIQQLFFIIIFLVLSILFLSISKKYAKSYKTRWIYGVLTNLILIVLGIYLTNYKTVEPPNNAIFENQSSYTAVVIETPQEKTKSYKTTIEIETKLDSSATQVINYKSIVYFKKDSLSAHLKYGDKIVFNSQIVTILNSNNPHEFDYKYYLAKKGIHLQTYIPSKNWQLLSENNGVLHMLLAKKAQHYLLNIYKKYGFEEQEFAVLAALTLGYKNEIDPETREAYAASGAMHILAVSGLHVGIIYMIISFLLSFLNKNKIGKIFKAVCIIFILWIFACISGLSPSVVRSALMFSVICIASVIQRPSNIYNTIAISAFILLLINPYNISSVGFLLSYAAVISIVYYQPKIYNIFYIKNWLGDKVWALVSVSIAAQIGTMPISFLFFHQFPTYFILTNIVVIPLASIILYFAITLFIVSWIPIIAKIVAFILKIVVVSLNYSVNFIENLPFSAIKNIFISKPEVLIFYAFIFTSGLFFIYKEKKHLQMALTVLIVWLTVGIIQNNNFIKNEQLFIYNLRSASAMNIVNNQNNYLFCDTIIGNNEFIIEFSIKNNWLNLGYKKGELHNIDTAIVDSAFVLKNSIFKKGFFKYKNNKFLIIRDKELLQNTTETKMDLDYIVLSNNIYISIQEIDLLFTLKEIIFDSSNKSWRIEKWKTECKNLHIKYYSVPDSGAFVLDL